RRVPASDPRPAHARGPSHGAGRVDARRAETSTSSGQGAPGQSGARIRRARAMLARAWMPNVKGSAIESRVLWVRLHHGEEGFLRLNVALGPEARAVVKEPPHK